MELSGTIPKHPFVRVIDGGSPEEICEQIIDEYGLWGDEARIRIVSSLSQRRALFDYVGLDEKESLNRLVEEIIKKYKNEHRR